VPPPGDDDSQFAAAAAPTVALPAEREPPQRQRALAEADVAAEWKSGDMILDLYEVKQIHEGGGMGLVYRLDHRGWNADLAVKRPRTDAGPQPGTKAKVLWQKINLAG
jgi:hypothetical protein